MKEQVFKEAVSRFTKEMGYPFIPADEVIVHCGNKILIHGKAEIYPFFAFIHRSGRIDISLSGRGECEFALETKTYNYILSEQQGRFLCEDKHLKTY